MKNVFFLNYKAHFGLTLKFIEKTNILRLFVKYGLGSKYFLYKFVFFSNPTIDI